MSLVSEVHYPESFRYSCFFPRFYLYLCLSGTSDLDADLYRQLLVEVGHLHKRNAEIMQENEELRQKTQVIVKKVETNIVETHPGMDKEAVEKISDLESKLDQAVYEVEVKVKEIEDLQQVTKRIHDLESRLNLLEDENLTLKTELAGRSNQIEIFRKEVFELEQLNQKTSFDLNEKINDIAALQARLKELENLPDLLAQANEDRDMLSVEVNRLNALITERDSLIRNLNNAIEVLKTEKCHNPVEHQELRVKTEEIIALKEEIASLMLLKDTIRDLEIENQKILMSLKESEDTNQQLRKKMGELISTVDKLNEEIAMRDNVIAELEKQKADLGAEIAKIRLESAEQLAKTVAEKDLQISELNEQLMMTNKEIEGLRNEMAKLVQDFNNIVIERDNLFKILNSRDSQITSLTESLMEAETKIKALSTELEAATFRISVFENDVKSYVDRIALLETENQNLRARVAELEELQKLLEAVTIERDTLRAEVRELMLQNENLIKNVNQLQIELDNARHMLKDTQVLLEKMTLERDNKVVEIRDFALRSEELLAQNNRLLEDLKARDRMIEEFNRLQKELQLKITSLSESLQILQHDKDDLLVKFEAMRSENSRLLKAIQELTTEKEHHLTLIDQRDNLIAALNKDIVRLSQENKELEQNMAFMQEKCDGLSTVLKEREIEIEKLRGMVDKAFPELDALREKALHFAAAFDKLEQLNKTQDIELNSLREQLRFTDELKMKVEGLTAQNTELRKRLEELERIKADFVRIQQQMAAVVAERDKLIEVVRDKDNEIKNLRFIAGEFEDLRVRYKELEAEISKLNSTLVQRETFIRELEAKIANLEGIIESQKVLAIENDNLRREIMEMTSKIQSLEYTITVTNEKYKKVEDLYNEIKGATEHLGAVHDKLVETVEETERVSQSVIPLSILAL